MNKTPDKLVIGLYKCKWSDGQTFYNYHNGTAWCWGISTSRGVEHAIGRLGAALFNDEKHGILTPMDNEDIYVIEHELVANFEKVHDE